MGANALFMSNVLTVSSLSNPAKICNESVRYNQLKVEFPVVRRFPARLSSKKSRRRSVKMAAGDSDNSRSLVTDDQVGANGGKFPTPIDWGRVESTDVGGAPVIDLAGIEGPYREKIAKEVVEACEKHGFFQVINHGVDSDLMKKAKAVAREFFAQPGEEKTKVAMKKGVHMHGYYHPDLVEFTGSGTRPGFEHLYNVFYPPLPEHKARWPPTPEAFGPTVYQYIVESRGVVEKILELLSESLGLEKHAMLNKLKGPDVTRSNVHTIMYNAMKEDERVAIPQHTDPGAVTVVFSDEVTGLQFQKDGKWLNIEPVSNALIVNLGDQVQILSNGRFKSGQHRAVLNSSERRLTIVNFYSPHSEAMVGPLDGLVSESNPPLFKTSSYGDYIDAFRDKTVARLNLNGKEPPSGSTTEAASSVSSALVS